MDLHLSHMLMNTKGKEDHRLPPPTPQRQRALSTAQEHVELCAVLLGSGCSLIDLSTSMWA